MSEEVESRLTELRQSAVLSGLVQLGPETEAEAAYAVVLEDLFLYGSPIGMSHDAVMAILRGAAELTASHGGTLAQRALLVVAELRKAR